MASLRSIVEYLDRYLETEAIIDYPQASNGLQLENSGRVTKLGAAVDASAAVIGRAVEQGVTLLLVHHGLMWETHAPLFTGARYRKIKTAMERDLAVYSSHLPLDMHPVVGNAVQLCKAIGLTKCAPFFEWKGQALGLKATVSLTRDELARRLERALGCAPHLCAGGPGKTRRIGVVTGSAGAEVAQARAEGVDTFITGEGPHWSYIAAEELGMNVFYGGHYATETFGVKALAAHLAKRFRLPWEFIDHPTGL
jgi:dinuclear metal center YbgI/SA1388 family protein